MKNIENKKCNFPKPNKEEYSVGLELEFFIRDARGEKRYLQDTIKDYGGDFNSQDTIEDLIDIVEFELNNIDNDYTLGFDGSGIETPEMRSPVFISLNPESCLNDLLSFSNNIQEELIKEYKARFRPSNSGLPCGVHFSIGGKFLEEDYLASVIGRAKELQPKFRNLIPDSVIKDYNNREDKYPGNLISILERPSPINGYGYANGIRFHADYYRNSYKDYIFRTELRFFPSCFIYSLEQCFRFLLLESAFPTKKIKFSRK